MTHSSGVAPRAIGICAALLVSLVVAPLLVAQNFPPDYNPLYDDSRVATVRITIDAALLDSILAPGNEESDIEHAAVFEYDDGTVETVDLVGFRLRGNTSRYSAKKSFKVSFNSFVSGQKFHGVEKLNLNGEHNDPTIVRSKIAWDLFGEHGVAASRAAHVRFYINGTYYGLYANVEHIDEQFLKSRFGDDSGNLYKNLWPADLAYLGPTGDAYRPTDETRRPYDLKLKDSDDEGYDDLAHFIDVLNNTGEAFFTEEIEKVFDVNGFLRSLAVDVVTGSWDNYWFLKNNYYVYNNPRSGLFEYIPYDFDNTFGIWWDGIEPNSDWATRDLYNWGSQTEPRPLTDRIMSQPLYVDRFSFFLQQLLSDGFTPSTVKARIDELHAMVSPAAEEDTYRTLDYGYSVQDFHDAFTLPLGAHVTYGLKPFVDARHQSALSQLDLKPIRPVILDGYYAPLAPSSAEPVHFFATVVDDAAGVVAKLEYEANGATGVLSMYDDGTHGDVVAGDGKFAAILPPTEENVTLRYRFIGIEMSGRKSVSNERSLDIGYSGLPLYINELMASNDTTVADEFGEFDDWAEIYNGSDDPVSLGGLYFTDNLTRPDKWMAPDTVIAPGAFVVLWLDDEDADQGPLHLPFKLSAGGEQFAIFNGDFDIVDAVTFGEQQTDVAYGRTLDGAGRFDFLKTATPSASNVTGTNVGTSAADDDGGYGEEMWSLFTYPNPVEGELSVLITAGKPQSGTVEVYDVLGRRVYAAAIERSSSWTVRWSGRDDVGAAVASGVYFVRVLDADGRPVVSKSVVRLGGR